MVGSILASLPPLLNATAQTLILFGLLMAPVFVWSHFAKIPLWDQAGGMVHPIIIGLVVGMIGVIICLIYAKLSGSLQKSDTPSQFSIWVWLLSLGLTLFQTMSEEVVFRGLIQPTLKTHLWVLAVIGRYVACLWPIAYIDWGLFMGQPVEHRIGRVFVWAIA